VRYTELEPERFQEFLGGLTNNTIACDNVIIIRCVSSNTLYAMSEKERDLSKHPTGIQRVKILSEDNPAAHMKGVGDKYFIQTRRPDGEIHNQIVKVYPRAELKGDQWYLGSAGEANDTQDDFKEEGALGGIYAPSDPTKLEAWFNEQKALYSEHVVRRMKAAVEAGRQK
jgi:hypothetical protein